MQEKKVTTNEELAGMIKRGFDDVTGKLNGHTSTLNTLARGQNDLKKEIELLKLGQEDIKLRLDQAAWRFEMNELDKRVIVVEEKLGIPRPPRRI